MRNVDPLIIAARANGQPRLKLVDIEFAQGTLSITNAPSAIDIAGGNTYLPGGLILSIPDIESKTTLVNVSKTLVFSGADPNLISSILGASQINRAVKEYDLYLNDDFSHIGSPVLNWSGIINKMFSDGKPKNPRVTIETSTIFDDFDRLVNRTTTMASQQRHFPNDTGMRFASEANKEVKWGIR